MATPNPRSLAVNAADKPDCANFLAQAASGHAGGIAERVCVHEVVTRLEMEVVLV